MTLGVVHKLYNENNGILSPFSPHMTIYSTDRHRLKLYNNIIPTSILVGRSIPPLNTTAGQNTKFGLDFEQLASRLGCYGKAVCNSACWQRYITLSKTTPRLLFYDFMMFMMWLSWENFESKQRLENPIRFARRVFPRPSSTVPIRQLMTSSRSTLPAKHNCRRAFSVVGPSVWNSLSDYLRDPGVGRDKYSPLIHHIGSKQLYNTI